MSDGTADLSDQFGPAATLGAALAKVSAEVAARHIEADVYGRGGAVQALENDVAVLLGKEAACFFMTGTLAQLSALRALSAGGQGTEVGGTARGAKEAARPVVAVHPTSHIAHHDCLRSGRRQQEDFDAHAAINASDLRLVPFGAMSTVPTLTEFAMVLAEAKPAVVVLELPQRMCGGRTIPWAELVQMRELATKAGVRLHMDGARLWEVQPFYDRPLADICALFDTVYVSFYKGIGAMAGSMLCGQTEVIASARALKTSHGGTPFSVTTEAVHAQLALADQLSSFSHRYQRLQSLVADVSRIESLGNVLRFEPPEPQSCLVHGYLTGDADALEAAHARVIASGGARLWNRFRGVGHTAAARGVPGAANGAQGEVYFEWSMGPANAAVDHDVAVSSWRRFADELLKYDAKEALRC